MTQCKIRAKPREAIPRILGIFRHTEGVIKGSGVDRINGNITRGRSFGRVIRELASAPVLGSDAADRIQQSGALSVTKSVSWPPERRGIPGLDRRTTRCHGYMAGIVHRIDTPPSRLINRVLIIYNQPTAREWKAHQCTNQ